ncbi:MAG: Imm74 family immunity protein [Anaeromyxobacteraceae bacterium]
MFRKRFARIVSDEGYSVRVLGRAGLEYREGKKRMQIDSEMLTGPAGLVVYAASIRAWDPPFEDLPIDEEERGAIVDNVRRAFRFDGFEIEVAYSNMP